MMPRDFPIGKLPEETEALARAVPETANELLKISSERIFLPTWSIGECMVLRDVNFLLNFYLAKKGKKIVFFFFSKNRPVRIVLDTSVSFRAVPIPLTEKSIPVELSKIDYRIVLPPFIITKPSARQMIELAPVGGKATNTVLLQVGSAWQDVLAFKDAELGVSKVQIRYRGKTEDANNNVRIWRLSPFIALMDSIREWISKGFEQGEEDVLEMPNKDIESEPKNILRLIVAAYISAVTGIQSKPPRLKPILEPLATKYGILDYQSRVLLRLKKDGKLASEDSDDPFQLLMKIQLFSNKSRVKARVAIGPPDFIISGRLHEAFISSLHEESALKELEVVFDETKNEIRDYLAIFGSQSSIFRVKRQRQCDTDVLVLPGVLSGKKTVSILRGRFEVYAAPDPPRVKLINNSIEKIFMGLPDQTSRGLDDHTVEYFLRLVVAIKDWISVLA